MVNLSEDDSFNYDQDSTTKVSNYHPFLYKFGIFLFPFVAFNPIYITQLFQQIQYTPGIKSVHSSEENDRCLIPKNDSLESRLLEATQYLEASTQSLQDPQPLPVDSFGYIKAPKEKVIGTCILEDGSLLSTILVSTRGLTCTNLATRSISSAMKILSTTFGIGFLWRGLGTSIFYTVTKSLLEKFILFNVDDFLFNTFLFLPDKAITISSEVFSKVFTSLLLLPLEVAKIRWIIQSRVPTEQKYSSILSCLVGIHLEEGGLYHAIYGYLGLSSFFFYLFKSAFLISKNLILSKLIEFVLQFDQSSNYPPWISLLITLIAPFIFNILQVILFQPFYISRLRLMAQFRPPQNKLVIEQEIPIFTGTSTMSMPFYYWSGLSPSSNSEPLIVRKLSVVRPFIVGTCLSPTPYKGIFDTIRRVYKEEGFSALYTGWRFRLLFLSLQTMTSFTSVEYDDDSDGGHVQD